MRDTDGGKMGPPEEPRCRWAREFLGARLSRTKADTTDSDATAPGSPLESTAELLTRVRQGDTLARERLVSRFLPIFKRWAHGRLPQGARDLAETDDLVQVTLVRALDHVKGFEPRRPGAFLAYLRQILMNQVRDEIRRAAHRPRREEISDDHPSAGPTPLDTILSRESLDAYEAALSTLPDRTREAVVLRLEFGLGYQEVAEAIESPSANAARMLIARALVQMAEAMHGTR